MMTLMLDEAKSARALADKLSGRRFGTILILSAEPRIDFDADNQEAVFLTLVLSDPAADTWPLEDTLKIRREVLSQANANDMALTIYVRLVPETDLPQEDDEESTGPGG